MNFYILIIKNKLKDPVGDDIEKFVSWMQKKTGLNPVIEYVESKILTKHKVFDTDKNGVERWGLDDIKDQIKKSVDRDFYQYHATIFLYEFDEATWDPSRLLGAWTYYNPLGASAFIEIPANRQLEATDSIYRIFTHEIIHAFHRWCWWRGIATQDTMDLYDQEFNVNAENGNRARNLAELAPYWGTIAQPPLKRMERIINAVLALVRSFIGNPEPKEPKKVSRVKEWALAIKDYEGYFPPGEKYPKGSRSYRNMNPGNLKYASQYGATGKDDKNFAIFASYKLGWEALIRQLRAAATGSSRVYRPYMTIQEFFRVYAPAHDNNEPDAYALYVANKLKISINTKISELV